MSGEHAACANCLNRTGRYCEAYDLPVSCCGPCAHYRATGREPGGRGHEIFGLTCTICRWRKGETCLMYDEPIMQSGSCWRGEIESEWAARIKAFVEAWTQRDADRAAVREATAELARAAEPQEG